MLERLCLGSPAQVPAEPTLLVFSIKVPDIQIKTDAILGVASPVPTVAVPGFRAFRAVAQMSPNRDKPSLLCPV